jgi:hypothetical protein
MGSFIICTHHQILLGISNQGVGGACSTHGRGEKRVQGFGGKARRKETAWETDALMEGWDQNGSLGDRLRWVWSGFSWLRIGIFSGLL